MDEYNTVNKTIHFAILDLMDSGLGSYILLDTLLVEMAKPVTLLDMATVPESKKKCGVKLDISIKK